MLGVGEYFVASEGVAYFGVLVQLAVATAVLVLRRPDVASVAFAAFVICNAAWDLMDAMAYASPVALAVADQAEEAFAALTIASGLLFVSRFPHRVGLGRTAGGTATLVRVGIAVSLAYIVWPDPEPLIRPYLAWFPFCLGAAWYMVRGGHKAVAMALLVYPAAAAGGIFARLVAGEYEVPSDPTGWAGALAVLTPIVVIASGSRRIIWGSMAIFTLGILRTVDGAGPVAHGFVVTAFGGILAYAVLQDRLLNIEIQVKLGISRGTVAAVIAGAAFIASELAEATIGSGGLLPALLIGGVAAFAVRPLTRVGERVASRLLPDVEDNESYRERRRRDLYAAALRQLGADAVERERTFLDAMRRQLGLSSDDARAIEAEARHD